MTFDNHGSYWDIDHIIPCSTFDLTKKEDILKCFHWSNMAPLEHIKNLSKNNKIFNDMIEYYKVRAEQFINDFKSRQAIDELSGAFSTKLDGKLSNGSDKPTEV